MLKFSDWIVKALRIKRKPEKGASLFLSLANTRYVDLLVNQYSHQVGRKVSRTEMVNRMVDYFYEFLQTDLFEA